MKKSKMEWNTAHDLLPPDDVHDVLVWCEYRACREFDVGYYDPDSGKWYDEKYDEEIPVTYWSYLPVPPLTQQRD